MSTLGIRWSMPAARFHEQFLAFLAFAAWNVAPYYYSDLVRGIVLGLSLGALVIALLGRHALLTILSAGLVATSYTIEPRPMVGWIPYMQHAFAVLILLAPISNVVFAKQIARRTAAEAAAH